MDSAGLINDLLIMASALGSAVAGVLCGWQLRGVHEIRLQNAVRTPMVADACREEVTEPATTESEPCGEGEFSFLPDRMVKKVLFEAPEDGFLQYEDSFAVAYGEQPQGLSQTEIRQVAERLIQMADLISADVDAHDAQLSEVNDSLEFNQSPPTMDSVMSAVEKLMVANHDMQGQLRSSRDQIVEQARQIETAENRANTDALTQVSNRRAFDRALSEWSGESPGVLVLLDIDHFKQFNDLHGHRVGDEVLRAVAGVLRTQLKQHCLVARYGGEEFGLVFTHHELEDVLEVIENARRAISANEVIFEGQSFHVTCSLGVTRMLADEPSAEWLQRADDGLYLSKDTGRNCGHCIDSKVVGVREAPYRLSVKAVPQEKQSKAVIERLPNCTALSESYRELLQRVGKAPVTLSIVAFTIVAPEQLVVFSDASGPITRLAKLLEVIQDFCRAVDRIGYYSDETLLLCMPGTESATILNRVSSLKEIAMKQLQVNDQDLHVGVASLERGDDFNSLVMRSIEQACVIQ